MRLDKESTDMSESRDRLFMDSKPVRDHCGDARGNIYSGAKGYESPLHVFGGQGDDRFQAGDAAGSHMSSREAAMAMSASPAAKERTS